MRQRAEHDDLTVIRLTPDDGLHFNAMLDLFAEAFDDTESYSSARPSVAYQRRILAQDSFVILVAIWEGSVVGALVAYQLRKFEQERSEFYIYDLAVAEDYRRRGIATAMINHLKEIAGNSDAWVIYVQADHGDEPAIALYSGLGNREDILHFEIALH